MDDIMNTSMNGYTFVAIGIICITIYQIFKLFITASVIKEGYRCKIAKDNNMENDKEDIEQNKE